MNGQSSSPTRPRPVPSPSSTSGIRGGSPGAESNSRATSIARLATPVTSTGAANESSNRRARAESQSNTDLQTPLPGTEGPSSIVGPGHSALAEAFRGSLGASPTRYGTPPTRNISPPNIGDNPSQSGPQTTYGSFESRSGTGQGRRASGVPHEDPKIVKRHLVQPRASDDAGETLDGGETGSKLHRPSMQSVRGRAEGGTGIGEDEFSSLQLQGGDMTRDVYRYIEDAESPTQGRRGKRSKSWSENRPEPEDETLDINTIKVPGGLRRDYIRRNAASPPPGHAGPSIRHRASIEEGADKELAPRPGFLARNFIEFLTTYGHFAGEGLEEDDDDDDYFGTSNWTSGDLTAGDDSDSEREPGEGSALLTPGTPGRKRRRLKEPGTPATNTPMGAALLLLKSFVGTGVLFLPKAYLNGGMLFSNVVLLGVAALSYYCFILLVNTRLKVEGSFGDMGGILYGKWMRILILSSVALSQVGFVSAYIVFTSENLQAFVLAVSNCRKWIDIKLMVLMQLIIFLPLSLFRNISALGSTALVADAFILLGLIYLGYFDISTLVKNGGVSDIINFNPQNWTLFIGTAIFTFEGVGLIIPIQESMKQPSRFPPVLAGVMILITIVFISMGALSYAAFGSATKTVVLLNLPQDNKFVNAVQLLYSLAILLSTPLQLFPAIRIMEQAIFTRSGKFNPYTKWKKNIFRFFLVVICALLAWGGAGDLDKFVSLVGSFACVPLVYVYPV